MTANNGQHPLEQSRETPQPDPLALALHRTKERAADGLPPNDDDRNLILQKSAEIDAALTLAAPTPKLITDWRRVEYQKRQWIIQDWLPAGRIGLLTGEGEKGKSLLAIQLAAAMAAGGGLWLERGIHTPMPAATAGRVVIAGWEDEAEEVRRRLDWIDKRDRAAGEKEPLIARIGDQFHYADLARFGPVWSRTPHGQAGETELTTTGRWLRQHCETFDARLLILDPLINAFGADENANEHAAQFMADWGGWARDTGCSVMLVHHPSKGDKNNEDHGYRGASAWSAEARYHWQLTDRENDDNTRQDVLICRKASYAVRPADVILEKNAHTKWLWKAIAERTDPDEV